MTTGFDSVRVEVITYFPTQYQHCQHCEVTWQIMGLGRKVHQEQLDSGLPNDLAQEFHRLFQWAETLPRRFGRRVRLRLVDVASLEGFFKSLIYRVSRYPAFVVDGRRYVGSDFAHIDALIDESLAARGVRLG